MASPETRLWVSPASKATSAAISKVHRLLSYPNSLGERWSIPRSRSADRASKAAYTCFGTGSRGERLHAPLVEGADGVANRLRGAPEVCGYLGGEEGRRAGEKDLAAAHHEGFPGAQPRLSLSRSFSDNSRSKY